MKNYRLIERIFRGRDSHWVGDGIIDAETFQEEISFLVLSGEPLNQPVVAYGSFVMTTEEDIIQANIDFHQGRFGTSNF